MSKLSVAAGLCAILLAGGDLFGQSAPPNQPVLPTSSQLNRFSLTRMWWATVQMNPRRDKLLYLTLGENHLYAQSSNGVITALDSETGRRMWAVQLGRPEQSIYPLTVNNDIVLAIVGMTMYAIERESGEVRWEISLTQLPSTSPTVDTENVYVACQDGSVTAFQLKKINELYKERLLPQWSYLTVRWRYNTNREITVPPVSTGRLVNFASQNGSMYAVTFDERELMYQFETDAPVSAPLVRYQKMLYVSSEDFRIYAVDTDTGNVRWQFVTGLKIQRSPHINMGELFVTPERGGMHCLDAVTGIERWWRPEVEQFVSATSDRVYGRDRSKNLVVLDRVDGAIVGALPVQRFQQQLANSQSDRIYLSTNDGMIVALREKGREFATFYGEPDLAPILPEFVPEGEPTTPMEPEAMPAEGEVPAEGATPEESATPAEETP